jgi:hypothetical protein
MTLAIKSSRHNGYKSLDEELYHKINTRLTILVIIISCLGAFTAIIVSGAYGPITLVTPFSSEEKAMYIPTTDLGSVNGFVISSDGLPVDGASVVAYKKMGFANSADKKAGYSSSVIADSEGRYVLDSLPSGVYKFTVTYPDNTVYTLDNYAVWPSSSSSYSIKAN